MPLDKAPAVLLPRGPAVRAGLAWRSAWLLMLVLMLTVLLPFPVGAQVSAVQLDAEQQAWIRSQAGRTLSVGFDPFAGRDSFEFRGRRQGLLPAMLADMREQLGLRIVAAEVKSWDDAYQRFVSGELDLIYGVNQTAERERIMRFTRAVLQYPYVVFARKDSGVQTLGDLDARQVAFQTSDFAIDRLASEYPNIRFRPQTYADPAAALRALQQREVDGFVTSGGSVVTEFLQQFPSLQVVAQLRTITSDMRFAVARDQVLLAGLIDSYLQQRREFLLAQAAEADRHYMRKQLRLSEAEMRWLDLEQPVVVGVAEDYLPFDYNDQGRYAGIMGVSLQRISDLIGLRIQVRQGSFSELLEQARAGRVHVLNMARTEERLAHFHFPRPISTERDIIVGRKSMPPVQDIYGLEGQRVAVVEGFWHEEHLRKNLKALRLVRTASVEESLVALREGRADYMIENPTVVEFYINGLGYTELIKRGITSKDSYIYFGVSKRQPELAAIMDKVIPLIDFEDMKFEGLQTVPSLNHAGRQRLLWMLSLLAAALLLLAVFALRTARKLIHQRALNQFLSEREHLLYTDSLTGLHNRNYFSHKADLIGVSGFPQAVVMADLNNLKRVNDGHGHAAGDALIQGFARIARAQWPQAEAFRLGGDEFLFILPGVDQARVDREVAALQQRLLSEHILLPDGARVHVGVALGSALRLQASQPLQEAMAAADARMYEAKAGFKRRSSDPVDDSGA